jgi:hypothetical protein
MRVNAARSLNRTEQALAGRTANQTHEELIQYLFDRFLAVAPSLARMRDVRNR